MGPYGRRATLGLIIPPRTNETLLYEMMQVVPDGVSWCLSTLGLREHDLADYARALEAVELCTQELIAREVSTVAFAGVPLTTAQGPTYHEELAARIRAAAGQDIPVTTDVAACTAALRHLGVRRVTVIAAYQEAMMQRLVRTLEVAGFAVASAKGIHLSLAEQISQPTFDSAFEMATRAFAKQPETDGFFLSCPQWPVVRNIARIEGATGRPVVTQLQAIGWWALHALGIPTPVPGYGRLLAELGNGDA
jgi:maleate isomerase